MQELSTDLQAADGNTLLPMDVGLLFVTEWDSNINGGIPLG